MGARHQYVIDKLKSGERLRFLDQETAQVFREPKEARLLFLGGELIESDTPLQDAVVDLYATGVLIDHESEENRFVLSEASA